MNFVKV